MTRCMAYMTLLGAFIGGVLSLPGRMRDADAGRFVLSAANVCCCLAGCTTILTSLVWVVSEQPVRALLLRPVACLSSLTNIGYNSDSVRTV